MRILSRAGAFCLIASLFFPGCSFVNYAMPLVSAVYDTLVERGRSTASRFYAAEEILSYEADGAELMKSFQLQLCDHLADTGIKRIVAACPNCVKALREGLALDEAMRRRRSSRASARYG